jgi:hypothetical protein
MDCVHNDHMYQLIAFKYLGSVMTSLNDIEWLGHVIRINETRSVVIFDGKLEGRRGRGRPRFRWIDDAEDDLRKLCVKCWRAKALYREEWASIIREAKTKMKGP